MKINAMQYILIKKSTAVFAVAVRKPACRAYSLTRCRNESNGTVRTRISAAKRGLTKGLLQLLLVLWCCYHGSLRPRNIVTVMPSYPSPPRCSTTVKTRTQMVPSSLRPHFGLKETQCDATATRRDATFTSTQYIFTEHYQTRCHDFLPAMTFVSTEIITPKYRI